MFTMKRMKFVSDYVSIDAAARPYGGSHRFYSLAAGAQQLPQRLPHRGAPIRVAVHQTRRPIRQHRGGEVRNGEHTRQMHAD
jgi:hypothetical protein